MPDATPQSRLSPSQALLLALLIVIALGIADGAFRDFFKRSPVVFWFFDVFKFVLLPGALLLWLAREFHMTPRKYGFERVAEHESWASFLGLIMFLAVLLNIFYVVVVNFAWAFFGRPEPVLFYKQMAPEGLFRLPVVLYLSLTAGFVEEIFFRGLPLLYLQMRFPTSIPRGWYVIATSVLFAASHWENGRHEVVATFVFGVVASLLYLKLRDLWPLVGAHTLNDLWDFW